MVTMMPFWAEKIGTPRTLAVEFPFGHTLGQPGNIPQQMRVIRHALRVLETADVPGSIAHSPEKWPVPQTEAIEDWQPQDPSPLVRVMAPRFREMLREQRRRKA